MTTHGLKISSPPEAELYRYAYDRKPLRVFTEPQWLIGAKGFFVASEGPEDLVLYLGAAWAWEQHLAASTIIPVGMDELFPPMPPRAVPLPAGTSIGCPWCYGIHAIDKYGWVMPFANHPACYDLFNGWKLPGEKA